MAEEGTTKMAEEGTTNFSNFDSVAIPSFLARTTSSLFSHLENAAFKKNAYWINRLWFKLGF